MSTYIADIHRDLVEKSKAGNSKAQYQLYSQYAKAMLNICYRMTSNLAEAEDLLQEAFTDAFRKLDSFRFESTFGAWLKRIVVNHCINHLNKRKAELVPFESMVQFEQIHETETDYDDLQYSVQRIMKAFEQLPDGYRVVFSLYLLEGYDHSEIAEILGITESTSKSQFLRAKQKIKEIIGRMNYEG